MRDTKLRMDEEQYLAFDRAAEFKHALWKGEVFEVSGASLAHNIVVGSLIYRIGHALRGHPCQVLPSLMRLEVPGYGYVYPDVTIVCDPLTKDENDDVLLNPRTLIEVLSPETEAFDRGPKFEGYRSIPGLEQVAFFSQEEPRVECWTRQTDGSWLLRESSGDETFTLCGVPTPLRLASIYED